MEFERQAFRFHHKILVRSSTKYILLGLAFIVFCNFTFEIINLTLMHLNFVDKNSLIKTAIEKQLKTTMYRERFKIKEEYDNYL